jgi:hypothetical protein
VDPNSAYREGAPKPDVEHHVCQYSKAMNEPRPRKCVICGEPEPMERITTKVDPDGTQHGRWESGVAGPPQQISKQYDAPAQINADAEYKGNPFEDDNHPDNLDNHGKPFEEEDDF